MYDRVEKICGRWNSCSPIGFKVYRFIGYDLKVMSQSACLVINQIAVDNFAALFNCTPVDRASDSIMAPT